MLAGPLAQYAPLPTRLCFLVDAGFLTVAVAGVLIVPEPVRAEHRFQLRPQRLRVPARTRPVFVPAVTAGFASFAVAGLFTAVAPVFLGSLLHVNNRAVTGLVVSALAFASVVAQAASARLPNKPTLAAGCGVLILAMGVLAAALAARSLPLLVAASVISGLGQGAAFRAGLAMVNDAAPAELRAAVNSTFFITLYVALTIPVIGVGAASEEFGLATAGIAFAVSVAALTTAALAALRRSSKSDRRKFSF